MTALHHKKSQGAFRQQSTATCVESSSSSGTVVVDDQPLIHHNLHFSPAELCATPRPASQQIQMERDGWFSSLISRLQWVRPRSL